MRERIIIVVLFFIVFVSLASFAFYSFRDDLKDPYISSDVDDKKDLKEDVSDEFVDQVDSDSGDILDSGAFVEKVEAKVVETNMLANQKAEANQVLMEKSGKWIANDYVYQDILVTPYVIQKGDTLWEIADGYYGDPYRWSEVAAKNPSKVKFIADNNYYLILPGDVLSL